MLRINITPDNLEDSIAESARVLRRGGIVAFPTDTVYGLGALAFRESAVSQLYVAKSRPHRLAIPVLIARISDLKRVARQIPPAAWRLAGAFWPGGLSLVLLKRTFIPNIVTADGPSVAVRIPNHRLAIRLIDAAGAPLAVTSANISGQRSATTADEVEAALGDKIDLLLDGGGCPGGVASTVVDMTETPPRIVRQGPVQERDLSPLWSDPI